MIYKLTCRDNSKQNELLCISDIHAKGPEEYSKEVKFLPFVSKERSVSIRKKKIEHAGFSFFVTYEIPLLKNIKNNPKGVVNNYNNTISPIEEIFLYKDKIELLNTLEKEGVYVNGNGPNDEKGNIRGQHTIKTDYDDTINNGDTSSNKKKQDKNCNIKNSSLVKKCINNNVNVYEILGVEESDDFETIKAAYKKLILLIHPDKNKGTNALNEKEKKKKNNKKDRNNNNINNLDKPKDFLYYMEKYNLEHLTAEEKKILFLKIQDSYAVLSDKNLRKQYDSSIPFDDSIPTLTELEQAPNFYEFLKPVFKRNAKWSVTKPVPDIGDENTNIKTVKYFYDFWYNFNNWRDFAYKNEYDYEEAECREERRWMERENKKIQKKASKAENLRIIKLVDLAYNNDPRIIAENKRIKLEKQKKKELSMLEKKQQDNKISFEANHDNKNKNSVLSGTGKQQYKNVISSTASSTTTASSTNEKKHNSEKLTAKVWKHHIKSICTLKLSNIIKTGLILEKVTTLSFETLCDFIFEIYVALNFNFYTSEHLINKKNGMIECNSKLNRCDSGDKKVGVSDSHDAAKSGTSAKPTATATATTTTNDNNNNNNNKNTGFINHLNNIELNDKDIELLVGIFKKYITDLTLVTPNKKTENDDDSADKQVSTTTNGNAHTDITCINNNKSSENISNEVSQKCNNEVSQTGNNEVSQTGNNEASLKSNNEASLQSNNEASLKSNNEASHNNNYTKCNKNIINVNTKVNEMNHCDNKKDALNKLNENKNEVESQNKWTTHEVSLLAKCLKVYPGGTKNRWALISNSIKTKNVKEIIQKTKEMFENDTLKNLSKKFDESPFDNFKTQNKGAMKKIDDSLDKREYQNKETDNINNMNGHVETIHRPWTQNEQLLLEKALLKYPSSIPIKERIELVAIELQNRTPQEVLLRIKTLRAKILANKAVK
uniref:J domain-containing protein n=1 Tax=Piliocolobus tephrosceles TaxID=591936 RepID=A0A8C9GW33_9PRIM